MTTLTHTTSFRIEFTTPDNDTLDRLIVLFKQVIAIIMFLVITWQRIEPVIWFVTDLMSSIVFTAKVASIIFNSVRFAI